MDYHYALALAKEFLSETEGMWHRIEMAGSIRRQRPQVHDVDLVGIPVVRYVGDLFGEPNTVVYPLSSWLSQNVDEDVPEGTPETLKVFKRGDVLAPSRKSARWFWKGVHFEVYFATPETFALVWLIRTGPNREGAEQNRLLALRAQRMGYKLAFSQGIVKGEQVLTPDTEMEALGILGLPYCYPENRDHPDWIKLIRSDKQYPAGSIWVPGGGGLEEKVGKFVEDEQERAVQRELLSSEERRRQAEEDKEHLFGREDVA